MYKHVIFFDISDWKGVGMDLLKQILLYVIEV